MCTGWLWRLTCARRTLTGSRAMPPGKVDGSVRGYSQQKKTTVYYSE